MTEILTESFCERCGTRYTFESVAPRQKRLGGIRVLGRGLKNFVLSDDSSLDEAMAAARSDAEREATAQQLDAFHRTFNFCMSCRQYTCGNCWNGVEARCLSCAPLPGAEVSLAPIAAAEIPVYEPSADDIERLLQRTAPAGADVWPPIAEPVEQPDEEPVEADAPADQALDQEAALDVADLMARLGGGATVEPAAVEAEPAAIQAEPAATAPVFEPTPEPEPAPDMATEPAPLPEPEPVVPIAAVEPEPEEPVTASPIPGVEPGESLDDVIAAYEASLAAGSTGVGRGVDVVEQPTWPTAAPVREPEPGPAPEPEPESEPVAAAPEAAEIEPTAPPVAAAAEPEVAEAMGEPEAAVPEPESPIAPEPIPAVAAAEVPEPHVHPEATPLAAEPAAPAAPELPPAATPPSPVPPAPLAPPPGPSGAPQWPTGPRWPTAIPARQVPPPPSPAADPLAAIMARQATEAMWAASSRDVAQAPVAPTPAANVGVQPCVSCGISLSASARFCRRCGTAQG